MKKLFLLDAYALIYRAYYAFIKNPRINSKGFNTSAVLGFVNTLEDVLKKEAPSHIGVAFDPSGPTFRHEAYEQYKAQREETPEAIRLSVPIIKDIIRAYRIPILEVAGYEADDVIGTLATEAGKQGITTYMMTPDKDYGQLVSENVFMYRPKYGDKEFEVMGVEEVKAWLQEKYEAYLPSFPELTRLMGTLRVHGAVMPLMQRFIVWQAMARAESWRRRWPLAGKRFSICGSIPMRITG